MDSTFKEHEGKAVFIQKRQHTSDTWGKGCLYPKILSLKRQHTSALININILFLTDHNVLQPSALNSPCSLFFFGFFFCLTLILLKLSVLYNKPYNIFISFFFSYLHLINTTLLYKLKIRYLTGKISGVTSPTWASCPLRVPRVLGLASSIFRDTGVPLSECVTASLSSDLPDRLSCRNFGMCMGGRGE